MEIEHVVVLCLENRSFDHMLGYLPHPDPNFEGLTQRGRYENPGWEGSPSVPVTDDGKRVLPLGPDHSHDAVMEQLGIAADNKPWQPTNQGFVTSYERKGRGLVPPKIEGLLGRVIEHVVGLDKPTTPPDPGCGPLVMRCQKPEHLPVLSTLALEFAVFDHWFCSVPGETWPNRNYLHAATSDEETDIELRPYTNRTIFELLEDNGKTWRIYHDDTPQVWAFPKLWDTADRHGNWFPSTKFSEHASAGNLATYSFIEPNHRPPFHTLDHQTALGGSTGASNSQHPENNLVSPGAYDTFDDATDTDFARGEALIASIYEDLRANPDLFAKTIFLITYDEHGGLFDHVPPPNDVPAPGGERSLFAELVHDLEHRKTHPFDFTMLGPRVPTVVVSPYIASGTLVSEPHDHASVPSTLRSLFAPNAQPLTKRDAWSLRFDQVLNLEEPRTDLPDLSEHAAAAPVAAAAAGLPAAAAETDGLPETATAEAAAASPEQVPEYYQEFVKQADEVRKHLEEVGEPEIVQAAGVEGVNRGAAITRAFEQAAHRHRHAGDQPS